MTRSYWFASNLVDILNPFPYLDLSYAGVPTVINCPFIRIPILEHNDSASFIVWVVRTIAASLVRADRYKLFQRNLLEMGSTPDDG